MFSASEESSNCSTSESDIDEAQIHVLALQADRIAGVQQEFFDLQEDERETNVTGRNSEDCRRSCPSGGASRLR